MIPRYNAPRPKGVEHLHVQRPPPPQPNPKSGPGEDLPMCTEIWTCLVAVSLISTHGDHWAIGHHHYGVVIPATPLPVSREILTTSETLHPTLKLAAKYD